METVRLLASSPLSGAGLKRETESFPALQASCLAESVPEQYRWCGRAAVRAAAAARGCSGYRGMGQGTASPAPPHQARVCAFRYVSEVEV